MDREEAAQILKMGVDGVREWNARRQAGETIPNLNGIQLTVFELPGIDLRSAKLRNSSIQAGLAGADFSGAELQDSWLSGSGFYRTKFVGANLERANLMGLDLRECDLSSANLRSAEMSGVSLREAKCELTNLSKANLWSASIYEAKMAHSILRNASMRGAWIQDTDLSYADLRQADLVEARLQDSDLTGADLRGAKLTNADLSGADLTGACLSEAVLTSTILVGAKVEQAIFTGCYVWGISAWDLQGTPQDQRNLIITPPGRPQITVDQLGVAQFVYQLLQNSSLREILDTFTSKVVLILGRFTPERKAVLDAIREKLRERNYVPILFDFEPPQSRELTETISVLAHVARFIIADLTDAKSIPQELQLLVPNLPSVPVQPILLSGQGEYGMFESLKRYPWVLETHLYHDAEHLLHGLGQNVIDPAERRVKELRRA